MISFCWPFVMEKVFTCSCLLNSCSSNEVELEPFKTEITSKSTPWAISLAEHLHSIGAKMYGAFWCTHCQEQKQVILSIIFIIYILIEKN